MAWRAPFSGLLGFLARPVPPPLPGFPVVPPSAAPGALTDWAFAAFAEKGPGRLDLLHQVGNVASCQVTEKCGYGLAEVVPARPPWPRDDHRHVRVRPEDTGQRCS
ncbi:hypothetical protein [Streptomyces sp. NPDC052042]|uniref:hypothetical protein n=1 Tax=Streptomyces sp. NPDC052042 TaxID=3365683 RepID=UPI0037D111D1